MSNRNYFPNSSNTNKLNNSDNSEDDLGSFNEEDEVNNLFMGKKELVHIENDTSINVDKSEDEHSKSSIIKKGTLVNNLSGLNEQMGLVGVGENFVSNEG